MFKTDLDARAYPPNLWRLLAPLVWDDRTTTKEFGVIEVPTGTNTDLGSTPQLLRRFSMFDPSRTARRSAVVHDYLYQRGKWPDGRPCTREAADRVLYVTMIADGYSRVTARAWWLGVRMGGWKPWAEYRKDV